MWSYRNDRADEIYGSANGPATVTTEKLPRPPADGEDIPTPEPPVPQTNSNLMVSGAGSAFCNGAYAFEDANRWTKPTTPFVVERSKQYPEPDVPWWIIRRDWDVLYQAPDCPFPWDAAWTESSFGSSPVPIVEEVTSARSVRKT